MNTSGDYACCVKIRRGFCFVFSVIFVLASIGCGPKGPAVVRVNGTVTKSGKPVANVHIYFMPDKGRPSWGKTDDKGHYEMNFSNDIPLGAMPGMQSVYFTVEPERIDEPVDFKSPKFHPQTREILQKFGSYKTTPLKIEVVKGKPVIDIELDDY